MSLGDEREASGGYGGTGQTRTRLPDTDPDAYGTPRRTPRSSPRSLVTVVGVVVLLLAAIAFANRGGDDADKTDSTGNKPETAATAPSGEKPVESKTGEIPTGYPQSEQGAQSAATNYGIALGSADMFDAGKRRAIVNTVYPSDVAATQMPAFDQVYSKESFLEKIGLTKDGTAPSGQTFISRVIPVGTKVTAFNHGTATVALWYTSLFGLSGEASKNPVTESWYTTTYELKWVDGDWKVTDSTQSDGPVPVGRDQRASTAEDMTKAVEEYGGFTYAR
ncbi:MULTISPECIES: hypothetical protein [Streptomyces]|uniref:Integral membrane protein n=1 Tax=Streptomyces koelreuteriae TaxID=2838015 RepID=A0ABX8FTZ8_9ACTN|nr:MULTISPECIES: hypothetical protein [Streptomyces]QWB24679.1 hypothetical protein KJK29_20025 [Streptomyces koelreuteriae]UUA07690.1 hypothetical protein NNW98_20140 [Streptomyces koelreuteriae]UUA15319.1 hypothetical protein NNW99_20135 [Streptomyces sp. CRCS-T-1]